VHRYRLCAPKLGGPDERYLMRAGSAVVVSPLHDAVLHVLAGAI
jgi:hypothetical protein